MGFAKLVGVALAGDPMLITSELRPADEPAAELHFLGTNFRTAQGRHGNFYFDEFFWVHSFEELNKVASGMATHKKWRKTYFSTPSTVLHPAYPYWTGERRNRRQVELRIDAVTHGRDDTLALGIDVGDIVAIDPQPEFTDTGLRTWHDVVAGWLREGRTPTFFVHTPDNTHTPRLARDFHDALRNLVPALAPLPEPWPVASAEQISLF